MTSPRLPSVTPEGSVNSSPPSLPSPPSPSARRAGRDDTNGRGNLPDPYCAARAQRGAAWAHRDGGTVFCPASARPCSVALVILPWFL